MRILVTGARDYHEETTLFAVLDSYLHEPLVIIHGAAPGADRMAGRWASLRTVPQERYPADWDRYGKGAGHRRNQQMLDEAYPDIVLAFRYGLWLVYPVLSPAMLDGSCLSEEADSTGP